MPTAPTCSTTDASAPREYASDDSCALDEAGISSISHAANRLEALIRAPNPALASSVEEAILRVLASADASRFEQNADLMVRGSFYLFEIGRSRQGIAIGEKIAERARTFSNKPVQRRIYNILGGQCGDIADFAAAMKYLELAVVLARQIGDPLIEAGCLGNVVAVLQEMGHYRQAIAIARRAILVKDRSKVAAELRVQCASNGLFAAHRIGDPESAARFLEDGERELGSAIDPLRRAFFERSRALYLVDRGQADLAKAHLIQTRKMVGESTAPRVEILLLIASALTDWGCGQKDFARQRLEDLYHESIVTRLYHHFVLQALIKVYSDAESQGAVERGLAYAKELVEFTTSVKKAKFYRQLQVRKAAAIGPYTRGETTPSHLASSIDPFESSRDWLISSQVLAVSDDSASERRQLAKHEELTAIHDDMARLRVAGLRREIRTEAVDTAENWAIAAEFFDDETGRHCFRVGHLASMLARELGMDDAFCLHIEHAARLHDIGKIAVNEVILLKPGPLDAAEMAAMRLHTEVGAQILSGSDDPTLKMAVEVARHHHEWWNGGGYPMKLAGMEIPISARISAFADVYDALTHARAYKTAWNHERALNEIVRLGGVQFDPHFIEPFEAVLRRYLEDLKNDLIPGFVDMDANSLIASRKKLMETIASST